MLYTMGQAARAVGKAKSTLSRDVKRGKISATRNPDGSLAIDAAELHRVYPPAVRSNGTGNGESNNRQPLGPSVATGFEQREIELLREQLGECRETIRDLRARLDAEAEERRRLTMLLADQRPAPTPPPAELPRSAWRRFLAWRR